MRTQTFNPSKDYRADQVKKTEKEIQRMQNAGIEKISVEDMQALLSEIGLKLDLRESGYLYPYFNTGNENHFYEATTSPIDRTGHSAYNVNGEFYQKHMRGDIKFRSATGRKLDELRDQYFCTYIIRRIEYIISF